jgi:hypothetical protein
MKSVWAQIVSVYFKKIYLFEFELLSFNENEG